MALKYWIIVEVVTFSFHVGYVFAILSNMQVEQWTTIYFIFICMQTNAQCYIYFIILLFFYLISKKTNLEYIFARHNWFIVQYNFLISYI